MHGHFYGHPFGPEHFYMQKVLPLVYDESLSYYEVVDKLVHKINEIGLATNRLIHDDLAYWIRKAINELFRDSFYVGESEKLVMVLTPPEDIFINDIYVGEDDKLVLSLTYRGEVCDG